MLGIVGGVLMALLTPLVAWRTHSPEVVGPLMLLAVNSCISGIPVVPLVKLSIDLRFTMVARLNTITAILATTTSMVLAIRGFGPYALVFPVLLTSIVMSIVTVRAAHLRRRIWPSWTRCAVVLGSGWRIALSVVLFQIVWQCDYLILGMRRSQEEVGIYFFAFQLSAQTLVILTQNLAGVLLPILGHLSGDSTRQIDGFVRAARFLCAVGIPFCFLQAAVASPFLRLIWHEKYVDAIPAFQALSVGSAFRLLGVTGANLLLAQGRFNSYLACARSVQSGLLLW